MRVDLDKGAGVAVLQPTRSQISSLRFLVRAAELVQQLHDVRVLVIDSCDGWSFSAAASEDTAADMNRLLDLSMAVICVGGGAITGLGLL
eukprot:1602361-Prymnesium_polylepis.1